MSRHIVTVSSALFAASFLVACTWVKIPEEARAVAIVEPGNVVNCRQLGNVTTQVKWKVAGLARNAGKVQTELDDLARKQALGLDADTLVRDRVEEGEGRYRAYACKR